MFFFDTFFNQAIGALSGTAMTSIQTLAYMVLAITFLMSVYEAFARGGDTRQLMIGFLKYVVCAVVVQTWPSVFTDIHQAVESIASQITSNDYITLWQGSYSTYLKSSPVPITSGIAATLANIVTTSTIEVVGFIFVLAVALFDFIYAIWGCILFCLAPLLIATIPSLNLGNFGKKFLTGLAEWAMWPVLYAIFGAMAFGMNGANVTTILSSKSYSDIVVGTSNMYLISVMSVIVSLCLLIIPFIAHFLIGASFDGVAGTAIAMTKMGAGGISGGASAAKSAGGSGTGGGGNSGGDNSGGAAGGGVGTGPGPSTEARGRQDTGTTSTPPPSTPDANSDTRSRLTLVQRAS